jgi:hypothetical protein
MLAAACSMSSGRLSGTVSDTALNWIADARVEVHNLQRKAAYQPVAYESLLVRPWVHTAAVGVWSKLPINSSGAQGGPS